MELAFRKNLIVALFSIIISAAVLWFDLIFPLGVADGIPYIALVLLGFYTGSPVTVIVLAIIGSELIIMGYFLSFTGANFTIELINRGLALFAVWAVTAIAFIHLSSQASLKGALDRLSTTDQLTTLHNHYHIFEELSKQMSIWHRYRHPFTLISVSLTNFENISQKFGTIAGDIALKKVANTLNHLVRGTDTIGRIEGNKFIILLPFTDSSDADNVARRIQREIADTTWTYIESKIQVDTEVGLIELSEQHTTPEELINAALPLKPYNALITATSHQQSAAALQH